MASNVYVASPRIYHILQGLIGLVDIWWGLVVLIPGTHQFNNSKLYNYLDKTGTPLEWGGSFVFFGATFIVGLMLRSYCISHLAALLSTCAWLVVFVCYALAIPTSTALPVTAFFVAVCILLYVGDVRNQDHDY